MHARSFLSPTKMSDSSSDESSQDVWTPYSERHEWSDVAPVSQDDGPHPVVQIAYSDKCEYWFFVDIFLWLFGWFRFVIYFRALFCYCYCFGNLIISACHFMLGCKMISTYEFKSNINRNL